MCGICGFNYRDEKVVKQMNDEIKHRGPNGEGFFIDKNVSLGHRRLSIIDLKGGKNPIYNEDKSICIMYNGEIYNFQEIRPDLEKKGHKFYTNSDTEVVVHAYEEYGFDCLKKFNGMFAFCLYDKKKNLMFIGRDRFGVKPMHYYYRNKKFIFASEIKALLKNPLVQTSPDDTIIFNYLINNQIPEDRPETFFKNIFKLMPSHYAVVQNGKLSIKRYYKIKKINHAIKTQDSEEQIIKQYRKLFEDSVRLRLISDVKVGSCLSGGIDSSSIVAMVDELLRKKIKEGRSVAGNLQCYSAVYHDPTINEKSYIKQAVKAKKATPHYIYPEEKGFYKNLKKMIYHQDEPVETMSIYAQWCVMKLADNHVTVLLDGQGSDECMAGYRPYLRLYLLDLLKNGSYLTFIKEMYFCWRYLLPLLSSYFKLTGAQREAAQLFSENSVKPFNYLAASGQNLTDRMFFDLTHNLPKVLKYEDRNSMAFGLEARLPFLDYRLVEYSFSLPESMKIRNGWTKYTLREALKDILPRTIYRRKSKLGFPIPDYEWLQKNKKGISKIFDSMTFSKRSYFNSRNISELFQKFCTDKKYSYLTSYFWRILNVELWLQVFFSKKTV